MFLRFSAPLALLVAAAGATLITSDSSVASGKSYDYVIAGAGLSGIVVANKLSARGFSVLVVEAGKNLPDHPAIIDAERRPELNANTATNCNWHYDATGDDGTILPVKVESGKCVGGSSSINGMTWYRPTTRELDALAELGNPGWDAASLMPYIDATERNHLPTDEQRADGADMDPSVRGFNGHVDVSFRTPISIPGAQRLYKSAVEDVFGIPASADLSKRDGRVCASTTNNIFWDAEAEINHRSSAAFAYLYPEDQQRDTLTVLTEHVVSKVVFSGKKATGLQFGSAESGELYTVTAKKEVLLAAGALGSPPILERSGVGSRAFLKSLNIPVVVDLPGVGRNLQDQPGTGLSALLTQEAAADTSLVDGHVLFAPLIALADIKDLFDSAANRVGKDLYLGILERAKAAVTAGAMVNIQGAVWLLKRAIDLIVKDKQPIAEFIGESYPAVVSAIFWPLLPLSRGHVHINSTHPFGRPVITPRFYSDGFDVKTGIRLAKKARSIFETDAFQPFIQVVELDGPKTNASDSEWAAWLKETSFGASHWLGSASMIPRELGGVVDPELKVYGTKGLRVVDASVLPLQITAHTSPMVYAVGHKAADLILGS